MKGIGILGINKPSGITSLDVVRQIKKHTKIKKIGHGGTLDPMATGVLLVLFNEGTAFFDILLQSKKIYKAEIQLGSFTDTDDKEGEIIKTLEVGDLTEQMILEGISHFTGKISQVPPQYSALKVNGRKAYDIARAGETVELAPRMVTVYQWDNVSYDTDKKVITADIHCGSGTYIRSLARDLATYLGTGGHLISLQRIQSGGIHIENTLSLDELPENWEEYMISPEKALEFLEEIVWEGDLSYLQNGKPLIKEYYKAPKKRGICRLMFDQKIVALVNYENNKLYYKKNLAQLY